MASGDAAPNLMWRVAEPDETLIISVIKPGGKSSADLVSRAEYTIE